MSHPNTIGELIRQESQRYHTFINLALFLAVLTGIEIVIIFLPWPFWIIMTVLVVLSVIKFVCVILWFMHLIYDKMLCLYLFVTGLILATGTMIALLALFHTEDLDYDAFSMDSIPAKVASVA
ncbi:cytochrome C oxidase subunit IV family protein [Rubellicoccus peritrichatus]|uniref:Cytochrome C oxidase subunit IV family protein n=1 Tax=Rubellicoccus peritrichatus TaxID=3080537 RepID=A0AAQ3L5W7_9BACT|nr:cytochrome C oxidase subunit IV family protein [Puniceicoccus sp. CR14]WOO39471.1 cytochrome C oxidase subunit IV family protein [Puniceicoccus sp. CR14]